MFAYLPDPFCLSGAFLQRIESYEGDHFFLSSEASNFAQRVHEGQSVDHSDARMRHQQSGPLVRCCQLLNIQPLLPNLISNSSQFARVSRIFQFFGQNRQLAKRQRWDRDSLRFCKSRRKSAVV